MKAMLSLAALLLAGLLPLACSSPDAPPPDAARPDTTADAIAPFTTTALGEAPDFTLPTLDGDSLRLSEYAGQVVVLNFWATWCTPCVAEMPDLMALHDDLQPHGLTVIGISLDDEEPDVVEAFAKRLGVTYPLALDHDGSVAEAFGGVWALPTTYIIGPDGKIVQRKIGLLPIEEMRPEFREMLGG